MEINVTVLFPGSKKDKLKAAGKVASNGTLGSAFGVANVVHDATGFYKINLSVGFENSNWMCIASPNNGDSTKQMSVEVNGSDHNNCIVHVTDAAGDPSDTDFCFEVIDLN